MLKIGMGWVSARVSRGLVTYLVVLLVVGVVCGWQLNHVALSPGESSSLASAKSLHSILHNPVNAPHQILEYGLQKIHHASVTNVRLVSLLYYLAFVGSFYMVLRHWFGQFSGRLGVLLFGFTPLLLLLARSASPDIMILWPVTVIAAYMWMVRGRAHLAYKYGWLVFLAVLCAYEPGGLWFLAAGAVYTRKPLAVAFKLLSKKARFSITLIGLLCLAPLVYGIAKQPSLIKPLLLIPSELPRIMDFLKWTGWSALALPWRSGLHNYYQVGKLGVLDASQIVLAGFGFYALWERVSARAYMLAATVVYAILFTALAQNYNLLALSLPALMVFATAGLRYLHIEWNSIFPRNPLPRGLALAFLLAIVGLHVIWGVHYALTAWPNSFGL